MTAITIEAARALAAPWQADALELPKFRVVIGPRRAPRLSFEVMAPDWHAAWDRHADLCRDGERMEVLAVPHV